MFDFLEKISKKPEHKKRIIAASISLGITFVIFAIWLSVILPTSVKEEVANSDSSGAQGIMSPLGAFGRNVTQAFNDLKGQLGSIKDALSVFPSVYTASGTPESPGEPAPQTEAK